MDELRFDGRTVVITGAGRGVGRQHALLLASRGARVVVADYGVALDGSGSSNGPADDVVREITDAGGEAVACFADVADEVGAASIVDAAMDAYGQIDVLVNNAGIAAPLDWIENLSTADYRRMIDIHYLGTVYVTKAAWPHLKASAAGRVVNTTSEGVLGTVPKNSSYAGGKGAVLGFTRALAVDGSRDGIGVNAVLPRADTRMAAADVLAHVYDAPADMFRDMSALDPVRVSPAVAYLAHESCTLQGELIVAGGGYVVRLALVEALGIHDENVTPETIAENIDKVLDISGGQLMHAGASIPSV
jgi:NAD(P)-dependent dehydrogenase (short-subunit alcohol dehydrogenase family)